MSSLLIHNSRLILAQGIEPGGVLIENNRVAAVFSKDRTPTGFSQAESIDLQGAHLSPGLIDIHIHGSAGVDVQSTDENGFETLSKFLLSEGVTGYFATLVPTGERGYWDALAAVATYIAQEEAKRSRRGARILGVHFEGPFVNERRCGALHRQYFRTFDGDPRSIEIFTGATREGPHSTIARVMTLAPEIPGGLDLIRELAHEDVRAFVGHSQAPPDVLDDAARAGAHHITHFPNALEALHHRKPGAVGWGLVRQDITIDCIADFHHVHPLMLRLMYQSKSAQRMALISDAIMPAGLGDGEFSVWGDKISVKNGRTALAGESSEGTLAGSVITLRQAVKNITSLGVPIHEAVRMATLVPAQIAGIDSQYGSIEAGKNADLIAFEDDFSMRLAVVDGEPQRLR